MSHKRAYRSTTSVVIFSCEAVELFKKGFPQTKTQQEICMNWRRLSEEEKWTYERLAQQRLDEMRNTMHKLVAYMKEEHFPQFISTCPMFFDQVNKVSVERTSVCADAINLEAEIGTGMSKSIHANKRLKIMENRNKETIIENPGNELLNWRRWEGLDPNLLKTIFLRVPIHELLFSVSSVCQSWQLACWDFMFWSRSVLNLSGIDAGFDIINSSTLTTLVGPPAIRVPGFFGKFESEDLYDKMAVNLMNLLWNIMEGNDLYGQCLQGWRHSIHTLIIPSDLQIADSHLLFIAKRLPFLNHIYLLDTQRITATGFSKAIQNWKYIKDIHLQIFIYDQYFPFIEEMGRNWQQLEYLHIYPGEYYFRIDETNVHVIAQNLPGLKKLGFHLCHIYTGGIVTLFERCLQLEEVYFDLCPVILSDPSVRVMEARMGPPQTFVLSWTIDSEGYAEWRIKTSDDLTISPSLFNKWIDWFEGHRRPRRKFMDVGDNTNI